MIADEADAPPEGRLCACCKKPIKLGATRGKGGTHCSDAKCRKHLYGNDPKAARIAELEARLADKDTLIASQKHLISVLQQQLLQPPASLPPALLPPPVLPQQQAQPPAVGAKRPPLQQLSSNVPATAAEANAKRPKPQPKSKPQPQPQPQPKPKPQPQPQKLPRGWTSRPSSSRPDQMTYRNKEYDFAWPKPPIYHLPCASYTIGVTLLSHLYNSLAADAKSYADLRSEFEECMGLEQGDVKRNAPLNAAFKSAVEKLNEKLDADTAEEAALEAQV